MPVAYEKKYAVLRDVVSVEDAEGLLEWVQSHPKGSIDCAACTHLHAANLQVLMAARPTIRAWPTDADLRAWLEGALKKS